MAVLAGGHHDDDASRAAAGLGGRHALDGLIDVLVKRIAAIGGDDDIGGRGRHPAMVGEPVAGGLMGQPEMPGHGAHDVLLAIQDDIDDKGQSGDFGRMEHVEMDRIVAQVPGARVRRCDEFGAMVCHDGFAGGDTRQDAFPPAGESGEEMGLDEALGDNQFGFHHTPVQDQPAAGRQAADFHERIRVIGVMDDDFLAAENLLAEFLGEFAMGCLAVAARCDEDGDVDVRLSAAQPFEDLRHDDAAWHGAGMVAGDDDGRPLAGGQFLQAEGVP